MTKPKFQLIPISFIEESPSNPRKSFDEEAIKELSSSIKEQGVIQPIVVREFEDKYEIVCGARRWRAAQLAGLTEIPAVIRELTDAQAFELQITENLQRKDIHPLDEAEAIAIMKSRGYTTAEVAERLGKSESFVVRRAKLVDLIDEFKEMFHAGAISAIQANLICRQTKEDQEELFQDDASEWKNNQYWDHSDLNVEWFINNRNTELSDAPFDTKDENLIPDVGACTHCPCNTAANTLLFPDMDEAARCTNSSCYKSKSLKSFEILLTQAIENPKILPIVHNDYGWNNDKDMQAKLKELGLPQPLFISKDFRIISKPEMPEEPMTIAQRMEEYYDDMETATEEHQEALDEYNREKEEYKVNLAKYEAAINNPNQLNGICVDERNRGKIFPIELKSGSKNAEAAISSAGDNNLELQLEAVRVELSGLESREKRAKELDREKIHRTIVDKLKTLEEFNTPSCDLQPTEKNVLGYFLYLKADYKIKETIRKKFKLQHHEDGNKEANIIIANMTDELFGLLARSAMVREWESVSSDSFNGGYALRLIADFDFGQDIDSDNIVKTYNIEISKRLERYDERKAALVKKKDDLDKSIKASTSTPKKSKK